MLIKTETKEKKEKIPKLNNEKFKSNFKINYKLNEASLVNTKNQLFDIINFNKYDAFMLINKLEDLSKYVPKMQKVKSYSQIISITKEFERVILRPMDFSKMTPVYFLEITDDYITITDNKRLNSTKMIISCHSELKELLQTKEAPLDSYFLQKGIKYIRSGELAYDIRVAMKKAEVGNWKCNSFQFIMGKNKILLNKILDKSKEMYLKDVLKKSLPVGCKQELLIKQINIICQKACSMLEQINPNLYEYEFDIAIDRDKKLWITDINVINSDKDFKVLDFDTYFLRKYASILYAVPICNFK